jgi:phenylalanyl-tRNA synthetase alpha chain
MSTTDTNLEALHALEIRVLRAFEGRESDVLRDDTLPDLIGLGAGQVRRAVEWLLSKSLLSVEEEETAVTVSLTDLGRQYSQSGTPESVLLTRAEADEVTLADLQKDETFDRGEWGSAFGGLRKDGVVDVDGSTIRVVDASKAAFLREMLPTALFGRFEEEGEEVSLSAFDDSVRAYIDEAARGRGKGRSPVKLSERSIRTYGLTDSGRETLSAVLAQGMTGDEVSLLTAEMLQSGQWKDVSFRRYDLSIRPPRVLVGKRHPYRAYLDTVRSKMTALGFEEMKGPLVETEFWNMDALFMPQHHAARNIHDAYFVKDPTMSRKAEEPFMSRVGEAHRTGGDTGSCGWRYPFDPERSRRLVLRTQGTALSARTLASGPDNPGKYFGMARCFRPDDVDATHASDFIQVEGIVLGESINFRSLLGLLKLFAQEVAQAEAVRYVPDYFPFTEPSVELQAKHPTLGWIELGGAGLFRPELTKPLGVDVPVIAWGLGVDRMAMVALGIDDIRDLFSQDLEFLRAKR